MAGFPPYTELTSDAVLQYAPHELAKIWFFFPSTPTTGPFNLWIHAHGGNDWDLGFKAVEVQGAGTLIPDFLLPTGKWIYALLDYPPGACRANAGSILPFTLFPDDLDYFAACIMAVKDNAANSTLLGSRTINTNGIVVQGLSAGARKWLTMALQPTGTFSHLNGDVALTQNPWLYRSDHRVRGVHSNQGQLDFTQFTWPSETPADTAQVFFRSGVTTFTALSRRIKWAASPAAHIRRNIPENRNLGIYFSYPETGSGLLPSQWAPGPNAAVIPGYTNWHDPFGVEPTYLELVAQGNGLCSRHWGNLSTNPANPYLTGTNETTAVAAWLRDQLGLSV